MPNRNQKSFHENMLKKSILISSIFCAISLISITNSTAKDCDATGSFSYFFKQIQIISSWEELKELSNQYKGCDDGVYAEGFSDRTDWLFLTKYMDFFKTKAYEDSEFYEFIKRHIDQTWVYGSEEGLKLKIENNCPSAHETVCKDLIEKIERDLGLIK